MKIERSKNIGKSAAFAAAAAVILGICIWGHVRVFRAAGPLPPWRGDALEYHQIAVRWRSEGRYMSGGQGVPRARYAVRVPGFPAMLVVLHTAAERVGLHRTALVRPANMALNLGTVGATFATGCVIGMPVVGAIGAGLTALYTPLWGAAAENMPECLFTFLVSVGVLFMAAAFKTGRSRFQAISGLSLGAATLVRATTQFMPLALLVALLAARQRRWKAHFVVFALAFLAAISPWLVRNYRIFHRPVGLTSVGGLNTFLGNYLPFRGLARKATYQMLVPRIAGRSRDEMQADRLLYRAAIRNIARYASRRPLAYAGLLWEKHMRLWELYRASGALPWPLSRFLSSMEIHRGLLLLAMIGLVVALLCERRLWVVAVAPAYLNVVHVLTYTEPGRYNLAMIPQVALLAGLALSYLLPRIGGKAGGG